MSQSRASLPPDEHARLALLYEVSQTMGTSLDLGKVLNQVMDAIIQLTGAERGFLMLMDPETGQLDLQAGRNVDKETIESEGMEVSRTVINRVVESGEPVVTSNAQEDPRFSHQASVIGFALRSIMCAPLRARGETIGAVYVDNRVRTGIFSENDLGMLAAFANQAAMAIENARLFTMTDKALAARVQELSIMQQIDRELNASLDFRRVMGLTLEWAVRSAEADSGVLLFLDEREGTARVAASQGEEAELDRVGLDHPVIAQVLAGGDTVIRPKPGFPQGSPGARFQVAVPVKREGRAVGMILLEADGRKASGADKVAFLERLADHAAIAIENARLYDAVIAATEAKSTFVSVVSHELRIPMTSIKGYTDMLVAGAVGPVNDMQREFLNTIRRNVERMNVLVSDLSDINRIESGRLRLDLGRVNLVEVVEDALLGLQAQFDSKSQVVHVAIPGDLPAVYADRSRAVQVTTNLLSNASKYSPEGRSVRVEAEVIDNEGRPFVRLAVVDQGIGISPEDQAGLFTQFFRSEDPDVRNETGWGLGLSIVKMMVEAQGGKVSAKSAYGVGSTFAFTLPVAAEP
jgi:signal transduction histidine kinase